ncbi:hypothetical protein AMK20_03000 [Streptomyces sp. TSRI0261]|nr:hypothetical protein AMK20_03000 [Streptomyces sp. TSRI0261]
MLRRSALWGALPLALVVLAGWVWYQVSDTGKRWRYEGHLESYCDGVLPSSQAAELTGLRPDRLYNDLRRGTRKAYRWHCTLDDVRLTLSRLPNADDDVIDPLAVQFYLPRVDEDALPVSSPLGGGWTGYTNVMNTVASLACDNGGFVVVTAQGGGFDDDTQVVDRDRVQATAELVTAAAARAADRWGCATTPPDGPPRVRPAAGPPAPAADVRQGTCAGLPVESHPDIAWAWGAHTDPRTLDERCVLSTSNELPSDQTDAEQHIWTLEARYGAQALAEAAERRDSSDQTNEYRDRFRATAQCPGSTVLARFSVWSSQRGAKDNTAAVALLKAFVLRATERHGCTDVRLPPPGTANDPPPWEKDVSER